VSEKTDSAYIIVLLVPKVRIYTHQKQQLHLMNSLPQRKPLPHQVPHWINPSAEIYFVTINCQNRGRDSLCITTVGEAILESVVFRHVAHEWHVRLFLLMPDHLHALMSFSPNLPSIRKSLSNWKGWTTRQTGIRWQRDFFEHRLRVKEDLTEKASYIRQNPVRAGLTENPETWPWVLSIDPHDGRLIRDGVQ
jgi:putative transposase